MNLPLKITLFILASAAILWVSRTTIRNPHHHGFYRFFVWELITLLFLLNVEAWFAAPFSPPHLLSWAFLLISLFMIYAGVQTFRQQGRIDPGRQDAALIAIEKTTRLVTTGIYHYIRHPFYSSLLFLCWGIFLKAATWPALLLALATTACLVATAKTEEQENITFFGDAYRSYMQKTHLFIPFLF